MVREFIRPFSVRSYESDAWGYVPTAVAMRYFEQTAVDAADASGYGSEFHSQHGTAWVVRRMTLLMHSPIPLGSNLVASTWLSSVSKVRAFRENKICDALTGQVFYTALTEWVYMNRSTYTPEPIPQSIATDYDVPGRQLQEYKPPATPHIEDVGSIKRVTERRAQWYEADSMGHINNTVYADWLDEAVYQLAGEAGRDLAALRSSDTALRGYYYKLSYKRSAMPGDHIRIDTECDNPESPRFAVRQSITGEDDAELLMASSVYGWLVGDQLPAS